MRMSRVERQAMTRERLLEAAAVLFARDGVTNTTIDRIALEAGYSTGAVYSNFKGKEEIFLTVLSRLGNQRLDVALNAIELAKNNEDIVDALVEWANECSSSGSWSLMILEHARMDKDDSVALQHEIDVIKDHWRRLGEGLKQRFPHIPESAEVIGAYLHEIAFAPAMTIVQTPTAGDLMKVAVRGLLASH